MASSLKTFCLSAYVDYEHQRPCRPSVGMSHCGTSFLHRANPFKATVAELNGVQLCNGSLDCQHALPAQNSERSSIGTLVSWWGAAVHPAAEAARYMLSLALGAQRRALTWTPSLRWHVIRSQAHTSLPEPATSLQLGLAVRSCLPTTVNAGPKIQLGRPCTSHNEHILVDIVVGHWFRTAITLLVHCFPTASNAGWWTRARTLATPTD